MTPEEMKYLLNTGMEPLEVSILKWNHIIQGTGIDEVQKNCALCHTHYRCSTCPIMVQKPYKACPDSHYGEWTNHMLDAHQDWDLIQTNPYKIYCPTCISLAIKVRDHLISLR